MSPRQLAWLSAIYPLLAVNLAYLISAATGEVPWCFPYLEGCTSISRAARYGPANLWFKATMLPYAVLLAAFWWQAFGWLRHAQPPAVHRARATLALGWIGALFLVLYVVFLGVEGPVYQFLRRFGITVYFSFTVLGQMLLAAAAAGDPALPVALRRTMLAFCVALLLLGLASLPLQHFMASRDAAINAIEWSYALLMTLFYLLVARAWRAPERTGLKSDTRAGHRPGA